MAIIASPAHHQLSASIQEPYLSFSTLYLTGACCELSRPSARFNLLPVLEPVFFGAPPVGLSVDVGSICGGLKARYIAARGDPSNRNMFMRRMW